MVIERPYILYVGNIKPHKNLRRLLIAFKMIKDKIPHKLVLIGEKDGFITGEKEVFKIAKEIGDRVIFKGYVDEKTLEQYFINAEIFVFPSLYEGFGLPTVEAMACGCPVIASCIGSLLEVCKDGVMYCDPYSETDIAEKMEQLLKNEELRKKYIQRGERITKAYTWDKTVEKLIVSIENII